MPTKNNSEIYYINVRDRLTDLVGAVERDNCLNLQSLNIHAGIFYTEFLNSLFDWKLKNANEIKQNAKGIDLIDEENKIIVQVSSTAKRVKVQSSLNKSDQAQYRGFHFYFIAIVNNVPKYKPFTLPKEIIFEDVYDVTKLQDKVLNSTNKKKKALSGLVEEYFSDVRQGNVVPMKAISKEDLFSALSNAFEREKKNNPSMIMESINESIFPMCHLEPKVRVDANTIG